MIQIIINNMSCVDLKQVFLKSVEYVPHQSSYWNPPKFMKSCNQAIIQVQTLRIKVSEFDAAMTRGRMRANQDQQSKMLHNLNENIKICQSCIRRLQTMPADMKTTSNQFLQQYKSSIMATLQMKLLQIGLKFKQAYQKSRKSTKNTNQNGSQQSGLNAPNLNRPLFIQQSQQQIIQEVAVAEYKGIQSSIEKISEMYKQTASIVRMHEFMIDSIQCNINDTEGHVQGGRKNLIEAHRKQSKNRPLIFKVFIMLYILTTVYIVFLS